MSPPLNSSVSKSHQSNSFEKATKQPSGKLRLLGIDLARSPTEGERVADLAALKEATSSGCLDTAKLPPVRMPGRAVFTDETGAYFTNGPGATGQWAAIPVLDNTEVDLKQGILEKGGFVSKAQLDAMKPKYTGPSPTDIVAAAMLQKLLRDALNSDPAREGKPSSGNPILDRLQGIAIGQLQQKAAGMLASGIIDGSVMGELNIPSLGNLANGLMGIGINQALDFGAEALLSSLFAVDDTSSQGEFLQAEAAKKLMDQVKSEVSDFLGSKVGLESGPNGDSLSSQINDVLGTPKSGLPLARTGDYTTHRGTVEGGTSRTFAGGVAIARATDSQVCPVPGPPPHVGGQIREGNHRVVIENRPAAAYTHEAICNGCYGITVLEPLLMDIQIGLDRVSVLSRPVPPLQSIGAPAIAAGAGASTGAGVASEEPTNTPEEKQAETPEVPDKTAGDSEMEQSDATLDESGESPELPDPEGIYKSLLENATSADEAIRLALLKNGLNVPDAIRDVWGVRDDVYDRRLAALLKERPGLSSTDLTIDEVRSLHIQHLTYADAFLQAASLARLVGPHVGLIVSQGYGGVKGIATALGSSFATDPGVSPVDNQPRAQSPWNHQWHLYALEGISYHTLTAQFYGKPSMLPDHEALLGLLESIRRRRARTAELP